MDVVRARSEETTMIPTRSRLSGFRILNSEFLLRALCALCVSIVSAGSAASARQQQDFSKVEIKPTKLADGLYMLTGSGGNIGLSVGEDAVFLVDDQYAPLTEKIKAAI